MKIEKILVSLVAVLALTVLLAGNVSAFATVTNVEISDVEGNLNSVWGASTKNHGAFAGETIPVKVTFVADEDAQDVIVKFELTGGNGYSVSTPRFDVVKGSVYTKRALIEIPSNIDVEERMHLEISVENQDAGRADVLHDFVLVAQRESYKVEILDVLMDSTVQAGESVPIDVVVKNRGSHFSEDTFLTVSVPELGLQQRVYYGDLSPEDQSDPDKEDTIDKRLFLNIPANAPSGVYAIEFKAFSDDSSQTVAKKFAIYGASRSSLVVSPMSSKTFGLNEVGEYKLTLVNSGNNIQVYNIVTDAPSELTVEAEETLVAIPAGTSRTVKVLVDSSEEGDYTFSVNVLSNGVIVEKANFKATVEGKGKAGNSTTDGTVVLTVILAIIFIVLLVVLIVLLTRKPQRTEEFGESYY